MLFEPGPLTPFTDAEIPQADAPPDLAAAAAAEAAALEGAATGLGGELARLAGAEWNEVGAYGGIDLAAAADEQARQAAGVDPAIANVAAAADAGDAAINGHRAELAGELTTTMPPDPTIPPDGYADLLDPRYPYTGWDSVVAQTFGYYLGRSATRVELDYARRFEPDLEALRAWVRAGAPLTESPPAGEPPPSEPPPPEADPYAAWDANVRALFVEILGREPSGDELAHARGYYPELANLRARLLSGVPL